MWSTSLAHSLRRLSGGMECSWWLYCLFRPRAAVGGKVALASKRISTWICVPQQTCQRFSIWFCNSRNKPWVQSTKPAPTLFTISISRTMLHSADGRETASETSALLNSSSVKADTDVPVPSFFAEVLGLLSSGIPVCIHLVQNHDLCLLTSAHFRSPWDICFKTACNYAVL